MFNCLKWICVVTMLGIVAAQTSCIEKEDSTPEELKDSNYISMLVDNSGWSTVAYDDKIFSGTPGASFPYQHDYVLGDVQNGVPSFLTYSTIYAQGSRGPTSKVLTWNIIDNNAVLPIEGYTIGILDKILNRETLTGSLPENLKEHQTTGVVYASKDFPFFYENEPHSYKSYYRRSATNLNQSWKRIGPTGVSRNGQVVGWLPSIPRRLINEKSNLEPGSGHVNSNIGSLDILELNGTKTTVQLATFFSREAGGENPGTYACLAGKYWDGLDSIDITSNSIFIDPDQLTNSGQVKCIGNTILAVLNGKDKTHFILGDFNSIVEVHQLSAFYEIIHFVKGKNAFVVIYRNVDQLEAVKIGTDGTVTALGTLPTSTVGSAVVFQDDLVIGYTEDNSTYKVQKISSAGTTSLGAEILTQPLTGDIYSGAKITLASDDDHLFAAIRNNLSPKFKGRITQWTGHEIIKYNN